MKTQRKKDDRLWAYLLYLGLVSSLILSVTLAKYASTAAGSGTATVAAMAAGAPIEMTLKGMVPGGEQELNFEVVNYTGEKVSEVALDYKITVTTTGNLPLTYALIPDGTAGQVGGTLFAEGSFQDLPDGRKSQDLAGGAFELIQGADFKLEKQTHRYTFKAQWPATEADPGYADEIDLVTITVEARQRLAEDTAGA